jgi:hypothetical protein
MREEREAIIDRRIKKDGFIYFIRWTVRVIERERYVGGEIITPDELLPVGERQKAEERRGGGQPRARKNIIVHATVPRTESKAGKPE